MIVDTNPSTLTLLFTCSGSIVPAIAPRVLLAAAIGVLAVLADKEHFGESADDHTNFKFAPFTALGVAISLFLGFRNNACYDRWWEGRKQWGKQLIVVRNLGRLLLAACQRDGQLLPDVLRLSMAHTHALRAQLRPSPAAMFDRDRYLTDLQKAEVAPLVNPADGILRIAAEKVGGAFRDGTVDSYTMVALMQQLDKLGEVQGSCERLLLTPLPFPYTLLVHRTVYMYILLAPFAMAGDMGWYTPLFNAIVAYTFFGLDELARQLERPFADEAQCLPIGAIARTIDISVAEALGDTVLAPMQPIKRRLM